MGINRKMKRAAQKAKYEKFARAWSDEKRFQNYLIEHQGATVRETHQKLEDGTYQREIVGPNGETLPVLGRRPTFKMWERAVSNQQQAQEIQDVKKANVDDLSWEEDTVRSSSDSASKTEVSS